MGRTACTEPQCLYKGDLYLTLKEVNSLPLKTGFDPRPVTVGFVVDKVTQGQVSVRVFLLPYHFHPFTIGTVQFVV